MLWLSEAIITSSSNKEDAPLQVQLLPAIILLLPIEYNRKIIHE
jgi:hypothetical protein